MLLITVVIIHMGDKPVKCPICHKSYVEKLDMLHHVEEIHPDVIPKDISVGRWYFNLRNKKSTGSCVICSKPSPWIESVQRYSRFCSTEHKDTYREQFRNRMLDIHGKIHLLDDPDRQKLMLGNRKISGEYTWSDGGKVSYTGTYEKNFLVFLDRFLEFKSIDVMTPSPHVFKYTDKDGKERFYIPDLFIPSLNIECEVKEGGNNPNLHPKIQSVDKSKEKLKDQSVIENKNYNYVKVTDNNFSQFINFLIELKNRNIDEVKEDDFPLVHINESIDMIKKELQRQIILMS